MTPATLPVVLRSWAAWAPGLEDPSSWRAWARSPEVPAAEGVPAVDFLPPMLRRRCMPLTRMMLRAAFDACGENLRGRVRTVFASRHGSINESLELLERVVEGRPLSPARFSHTVHNAQAGLYSIAAGNRAASSSLAGQEETFGAGILESLAMLDREPDCPVLLVVGDAPLSPTFAPLVDEPLSAYAVALVLGEGEGGLPLRVEFSPTDEPPQPTPWPPALEMLRWLLGDEPVLELAGPRTTLRLERAAGAPTPGFGAGVDPLAAPR